MDRQLNRQAEMNQIQDACKQILKGKDTDSILRSLPLRVRNDFLEAARIVVDSGKGNKKLATRVLSTLVCPGLDGKRIVSWNVDSIRAGIVDAETAACKRKERPVLDTSPMGELIRDVDPDIICIQETKLQSEHEACFSHEGYHTFWSSSRGRKAYSGVSIWTKEEPIRVSTELPGAPDDLQEEGRILTAFFDGFAVVNTYVPNTLRGGTKPKGGWCSVRDEDSRVEREAAYDKYVGGRQSWDDAMLAYLKRLKKEVGRVVWCGDLNVARGLRDIHNGEFSEEKADMAEAAGESEKRVKDLRKRTKEAEDWAVFGGGAGFRLEERAGLEKILDSGFVDVYRSVSDGYGFTFHDRTKLGYFAAGNGWRIDYFVVSDNVLPCVRSIEVLKELGLKDGKPPSDHSPLYIRF